MAESINDMLSDLDNQMFNNFVEYSETIMNSWAQFRGNEGQMALIRQHVLPAATEHIGLAAMYWPRGAQPSGYAEALYNCYEPDVIHRAFSNTISDVMDELIELNAESETDQVEHERLCAIIGAVWEPHSVYPPFYGGGGRVTQRTGAGREGLPAFGRF